MGKFLTHRTHSGNHDNNLGERLHRTLRQDLNHRCFVIFSRSLGLSQPIKEHTQTSDLILVIGRFNERNERSFDSGPNWFRPFSIEVHFLANDRKLSHHFVLTVFFNRVEFFFFIEFEEKCHIFVLLLLELILLAWMLVVEIVLWLVWIDVFLLGWLFAWSVLLFEGRFWIHEFGILTELVYWFIDRSVGFINMRRQVK